MIFFSLSASVPQGAAARGAGRAKHASGGSDSDTKSGACSGARTKIESGTRRTNKREVKQEDVRLDTTSVCITSALDEDEDVNVDGDSEVDDIISSDIASTPSPLKTPTPSPLKTSVPTATLMSPASAAVASILQSSPGYSSSRRRSRSRTISNSSSISTYFNNNSLSNNIPVDGLVLSKEAAALMNTSNNTSSGSSTDIALSTNGTTSTVTTDSLDTIGSNNILHEEDLAAAAGELIFLPPEDLEGLSTPEDLQNCMQFIALSNDINGTKQIIYQKDDGTYHALNEAAMVTLRASAADGGIITDGQVTAIADGDMNLMDVDDGTPVVMGQDGLMYTVNDLESAMTERDDDHFYDDSFYKMHYVKPIIQFSKEVFEDDDGFDAEKYVFKVRTGQITQERREAEVINNTELVYHLKLGIDIDTHWDEDPAIPKKKTVHVDENCLDYGGSIFHMHDSGDPSDHFGSTDSKADIQYDETLKKILIPLGDHGYMRVYGRKSSVDKKIVDKYPVPNMDLCRALALPLFRNHIMQLGVNVLIMGTTFFMVTADHISVDGKEEVNVAVSEPDHHVSLMREHYYNFVEVLGWERASLCKEKSRVLNIIDKNELNLHQCSICKKSYKTTTTLAAHIDKWHRQDAQAGSDIEMSSDDEEDSRIYTCKYCDEMCFSMSGLNQHLMEEHPTTVEKNIQIKVNGKSDATSCFMCDQKQSTADLPLHLKDHHLIKMVKGDILKCLICEAYCNNAVDMVAHQKRHDPDTSAVVATSSTALLGAPVSTGKKVSLPECKQTKQPQQSKRAFDIVHRCGVCASVFGSKRQIFQHLITHTNLRPFKCAICEETFTFRRTLIRHCNESHPEISTQFCKRCALTFETVSMLKRHVCIATKGDFQCPYCDWDTKFDIRLFRHLSREHNVTNGYYCSYCRKSFPSINKLRYHQKCLHKTEYELQTINKARYKEEEDELGKSEVGEPLKEEDVVIKQDDDALVYFVNPQLGTPIEKDRSVVCYYCCITFSTKNAMRRHIQHQHPEKPLYKCIKCAIVFKNNAQYCDHHKRYHQPSILVTRNTKDEEGPDLQRMAHQVRVVQEKLDNIGSQFHKLQATGIKCHVCNMYFNTEALLDIHYETLHACGGGGEKNRRTTSRKVLYLAYYTCIFDPTLCSIRFDTKKLIQEHLENAHGVTDNFSTMYKEEIFETAPRLGRKPRNSVKINNSVCDENSSVSRRAKKNRLQCKSCLDVFSSITHLRSHRFYCRGGKPSDQVSTPQKRVCADSAIDEDRNWIGLDKGSLNTTSSSSSSMNCVVTINVGLTAGSGDQSHSAEPESIVCKTDPDCFFAPDEIFLEPIKVEPTEEDGRKEERHPIGRVEPSIVVGALDQDDNDLMDSLVGPQVEEIKKEIELSDDCNVIMKSVVRVGDPLRPVTKRIDAENINESNSKDRVFVDPGQTDSDESFINIDDAEEGVNATLENNHRISLLQRKPGKLLVNFKGMKKGPMSNNNNTRIKRITNESKNRSNLLSSRIIPKITTIDSKKKKQMSKNKQSLGNVSSSLSTGKHALPSPARTGEPKPSRPISTRSLPVSRSTHKRLNDSCSSADALPNLHSFDPTRRKKTLHSRVLATQPNLLQMGDSKSNILYDADSQLTNSASRLLQIDDDNRPKAGDSEANNSASATTSQKRPRELERSQAPTADTVRSSTPASKLEQEQQQQELDQVQYVFKRRRRGVECDRCDEKFTTQAELTMHIRYDH